ncbi:MAG: SUMF1/EgtB/PvdO family nonheme iron enzyme [Lentisphaerae bacterium]|nr:SUMF1/EgtB/PvdO family nonheme iron enzyme [Lentisphaerota bacterium]MBT7055663.1 SUMF1/EgtB/PvdO family nonheme iron enzyme [Lentisphaerota bacterium]
MPDNLHSMDTLLFPLEAQPIACQHCASAANSPLAVVCDSCGRSLDCKTAFRKMCTWVLLYPGFIFLAAATGVSNEPVWSYIIVSAIFIFIGRSMLKCYRASLDYFTTMTLTVQILSGISMYVLKMTPQGICSSMTIPIVWIVSTGSISASILILSISIMSYHKGSNIYGICGSLMSFSSLTSIFWLLGSLTYNIPIPRYAIFIVACSAGFLSTLMLIKILTDGFRVRIRRPGVMIEPIYPLKRPAYPLREGPANGSPLATWMRPVSTAFERSSFFTTLTLYYMLVSLTISINRLSFMALFIIDLIVRLAVLISRRSAELSRSLSRTIMRTLGYSVWSLLVLSRSIFIPLILVILSAILSAGVSLIFLEYIKNGDSFSILPLLVFSLSIYSICSLIVSLLASCHTFSSVIRESVAAFSLYLPKFLILVFFSSVILSSFSALTSKGIHRFGPISKLLVVLFSSLVVKLMYEEKKKWLAALTVALLFSGLMLQRHFDISVTQQLISAGKHEEALSELDRRYCLRWGAVDAAYSLAYSSLLRDHRSAFLVLAETRNELVEEYPLAATSAFRVAERAFEDATDSEGGRKALLSCRNAVRACEGELEALEETASQEARFRLKVNRFTGAVKEKSWTEAAAVAEEIAGRHAPAHELFVDHAAALTAREEMAKAREPAEQDGADAKVPEHWTAAVSAAFAAENAYRDGDFRRAQELWQKSSSEFTEGLMITQLKELIGALVAAEAAKAEGNWEDARTALAETRSVASTRLLADDDSQLTRRLKAALQARLKLAESVEQHLHPQIRIIAVANGLEAPGGIITVDGKQQEATTPATFRLGRGKTYIFGVALPAEGKTRYTTFHETLTADWAGKRDMRAEMAELIDPTVGNVLNMAFVEVPPGSFLMGSNDDGLDEIPVRKVWISQAFWIGKYEVTQAEYEKLTGMNPSPFKGPQNPVETVSWDAAVAFCGKLTAQERSAGRLPAGYEYRLPTEAEWEYAARGGPQSQGFTYSGSNDLDEVGWSSLNSREKTHPVGERKGNELGIHDMSGSVWEWCLDWYRHDYYTNAPQEDPVNTVRTLGRVDRGGGWTTSGSGCSVARRYEDKPGYSSGTLGFRVCLARSVR